MKNLKELKTEYNDLFFKTGNLYYFLIAQELDKTIEAKIENKNNQTEELSL